MTNRMSTAMTVKRLVIIALFAFLSISVSTFMSTSAAHAWPARVVAVTDGDTITVEPLDGGDRVKVRLYGIDCPESKQPYGQVAKGFVNKAVLFQQVEIDQKDIDRYKRVVAHVLLQDGRNLQELLLQAGLAWVYDGYCKNCQLWKVLQAEAKTERRGLWADKNSVPPWEWRRAQRGAN